MICVPLPDTPIDFAAFSISSSLLVSLVVVVHFWEVEDTLGTFRCTTSSWDLRVGGMGETGETGVR